MCTLLRHRRIHFAFPFKSKTIKYFEISKFPITHSVFEIQRVGM